jgi:esterase/lipase superfamily enzyme
VRPDPRRSRSLLLSTPPVRMLPRMHRRQIVPLLAAWCLAGCASVPLGGVIRDSGGERAANIAVEPTLMVVTTRKAVKDATAAPWFGSERASQMSIARVQLISPAQAGRFSLASTGLVDWQIERVERVPVLSAGEPVSAEPGPRDVLVYIHGYNQTFESAALDAARLSDGLRFHGDTVLFSWPSRSKLLDYVRDRESAVWSRDALETTLESLLASPNIGRIHLVAHSMGSMLTIEGLRQVYAHQSDRVAEKMGAIVFASPDLDVDGFSASVTRMGRLAGKMTIITATDDRALAMATRVAGGNRVGSAEKAQLERLGLRVVDASGLGWGIINHDRFLTSPDVKQVIRRAIEDGKQPNHASATDFLANRPQVIAAEGGSR